MNAMDEMAVTPPTETPARAVAALVDGGSMDCGSSLLLLIIRTMRRLEVWAELVGHSVTASVAESGTGPWWFAVRKAASRTGEAAPATVFSAGGRTPVGRRLWAYTNAMVFAKGSRRETLETLGRSVSLQVSLDSATPELRDTQRGRGSWARALEGIHEANRVVRPVAREGFADIGVRVSTEAVTNPHLRIADAPLPIAEVLGVVRDTLAVHDAAAASGWEVFRCA